MATAPPIGRARQDPPTSAPPGRNHLRCHRPIRGCVSRSGTPPPLDRVRFDAASCRLYPEAAGGRWMLDLQAHRWQRCRARTHSRAKRAPSAPHSRSTPARWSRGARAGLSPHPEQEGPVPRPPQDTEVCAPRRCSLPWPLQHLPQSPPAPGGRISYQSPGGVRGRANTYTSPVSTYPPQGLATTSSFPWSPTTSAAISRYPTGRRPARGVDHTPRGAPAAS